MDFLNKTVKAMVDVRVHSVSSSSQRWNISSRLQHNTNWLPYT